MNSVIVRCWGLARSFVVGAYLNWCVCGGGNRYFPTLNCIFLTVGRYLGGWIIRLRGNIQLKSLNFFKFSCQSLGSSKRLRWLKPSTRTEVVIIPTVSGGGGQKKDGRSLSDLKKLTQHRRLADLKKLTQKRQRADKVRTRECGVEVMNLTSQRRVGLAVKLLLSRVGTHDE